MLPSSLLLFLVFALTTARNSTWLIWGQGTLPNDADRAFGLASACGSVLLSIALLIPSLRRRANLSIEHWLACDFLCQAMFLIANTIYGVSHYLLFLTFLVNTILSSFQLGWAIQQAIYLSQDRYFAVRCFGTLAYVGTIIVVMLDSGLGVVIAIIAMAGIGAVANSQHHWNNGSKNDLDPTRLVPALTNRSLVWITTLGVVTACASRIYESCGLPEVLRSDSAIMGLLLLGALEVTSLLTAKWLTRWLNVVVWNVFLWVLAYMILEFVNWQPFLFALPFMAVNCLATTQIQIAGEVVARKENVRNFQVWMSNISSFFGLIVVTVAKFQNDAKPWPVGLAVASCAVVIVVVMQRWQSEKFSKFSRLYSKG
jgi:hypothetical protein